MMKLKILKVNNFLKYWLESDNSFNDMEPPIKIDYLNRSDFKLNNEFKKYEEKFIQLVCFLILKTFLNNKIKENEWKNNRNKKLFEKSLEKFRNDYLFFHVESCMEKSKNCICSKMKVFAENEDILRNMLEKVEHNDKNKNVLFDQKNIDKNSIFYAIKFSRLNIKNFQRMLDKIALGISIKGNNILLHRFDKKHK